MPQRKAAFCALCKSRCGAQYVIDDGGRMVGVEPWPEHPTGAALCAKGRAAPELLYHPKRLRRPLKRTRPRDDPDPGWVEVSWDEALDDIAIRLNGIKAEHGAEAVAFSSASPGATAMSDSLDWIERLVFAFGSPNFLTGVEICNWHKDFTHAFTFGTGIGMPDYAQSDLVILWGFNPGNVWLSQAQALGAARARGAKLLVVDPARTRHARDADVWLRVKSGTDAALALGLAHCLIERGSFDEDFVRRWSNAPFLVRDDDGAFLTERHVDPSAGSERPLAWNLSLGCVVPVDTGIAMQVDVAQGLALRGSFDVVTPKGTLRCRPAFEHYAAACKAHTPQYVEQLTGIPAAQIEEAAALIADAKRVSYFCWTGISQTLNATQADRAIALLYALTGSADAPGGNLQLTRPAVKRANDRSLLSDTQRALALGLAERPLGPPAFGWTLGRDFHDAVLAGEPYKVRALVGFGANVLMSQADTPRARAALQALEFQVHCDVFETPTGRHADYLLPVNTLWEREGLSLGFEISADAVSLIQLRQRVVDQHADNHARSDLDIVFALATRLGLGAHFFDGDVDAAWNDVLAPVGLDVAILRAHPAGIRVPLAQRMRKYAEIGADGAPRGFDTPTRRVEFYSQRLHDHGHPAVPRSDDPMASVARDATERARFPLTLGCAKSGYFCQSQHRALASLRRREPEPFARLHPALAASRDIAEGDWMIVRTRNGQARFRARFDDALEPDTVLASFGWWQACDDLGLVGGDPLAAGHSHFNALVSSESMDALSGSIALRAFPCEVEADDAVAGRMWNGWKDFDARVRLRAGADVMELDLSPCDGAPLPAFLAGQYVPVALSASSAANPPHALSALQSGRLERSYSLVGPARVDGCASYRIMVKRSRQPGGMSERLFDAFAQDDRLGRSGGSNDHIASAGPIDTGVGTVRVALQTPRGRFLLPFDRSTPVVLIAAGIGITPFLSMLETLVGHAGGVGDQPIVLLYGSRDTARPAIVDRLDAMAARLPCLTVQAVDRVDVDQQIASQWIARHARFYLCGPDAMMRDATTALLARGVGRYAIFRESFQPPSPGDDAAAGPYEVRFARSGRALQWTAADGSLIRLAARHGIALASGCEVGQCESCLLRVASGSVRHLAEVELADADSCLACVAVPTSDVVLDA